MSLAKDMPAAYNKATADPLLMFYLTNTFDSE